ncbi:MAG: acetylglutamate kinase, partial [Muribaculaceae bacterium]|nr:acetylglutamate kinase [Muribaculaceae bacterium]
HGGGKEATELSDKLGIKTTLIEGRRITGLETINVVTMVYAGLINKRIVAELQALGCDAIGLSGADANVIPAIKRSSTPVDYGFVGDIYPESINVKFIDILFKNAIVPVFCAICHDNHGQLLNCNADSVASSIAMACSAIDKVNLIYCFEKSGILINIDDENSLIPTITQDEFDHLKATGVISKGMIPKVENSLNAVRKGVSEVRICKAENLLSGEGTLIL